MARKSISKINAIIAQRHLYDDCSANMEWHSYTAAMNAFYCTSDYHRPSRDWADGGRRLDAWFMNAAEQRGIVFG